VVAALMAVPLSARFLLSGSAVFRAVIFRPRRASFLQEKWLLERCREGEDDGFGGGECWVMWLVRWVKVGWLKGERHADFVK
jgi:hypothetical protein